jgi:N-acetylglucosaminyldiphosphoundecaprenol N-acetyl-beta-D-mannosaminyltransferase
VLERADLCLPDGAGLLWASRRLGRPIPQRVAGVDLVRSLARAGAREGWKFFFLGSREGVAQAAARVLQDENPGLQVVGSLAGGPGPEWDERSTAAVRASGAQVLLVAYGAPAQDMWISRNLKSSGARVAMGVGGAFDFISGRSRRAPNWMRQRGLEWLHRLGREPWRWRRMLALPAFVVEVSKQVRQKNAPARP